MNYIDTSSHLHGSSLSVYDGNMDQLRDGGPISQNINSLFQLIPAKFREHNCEKEPIHHPKQDSGAVSKWQGRECVPTYMEMPTKAYVTRKR